MILLGYFYDLQLQFQSRLVYCEESLFSYIDLLTESFLLWLI